MSVVGVDVVVYVGSFKLLLWIGYLFVFNECFLCVSFVYVCCFNDLKYLFDLMCYDCLCLCENDEDILCWCFLFGSGIEGELWWVIVICVSGVLLFNDGIVIIEWVFVGFGIVECFEWDVVLLLVNGKFVWLLFGWNLLVVLVIVLLLLCIGCFVW